MDRTYLTAVMNDGFRRQMHDRMKRARSLGCPVAGHAGSIALRLFAENNPHAKRLVEEGIITMGNINRRGERVRFAQEYTSIDKGLIVFADLLDK
ncbi:MAG TPA: hypothetical protein VLH38_04490, partial [Patescibacteria group bacterium]|nr:hypothetical protein [Patescibacteria group bacterium]